MKLPQVEFTSPTEWNPDIHDDNRTLVEMIRQFPAVPHDAVNKFYDLKGNANLDYLRSAKNTDIATEVDYSDESINSGMPGPQTRHCEDTSSDNDSDYDKKLTKASTTMQWKVPIDDSDGEKFTCQRVREQRTKRNAKCLHNRRKKAALRKVRIKNIRYLLRMQMNLLFRLLKMSSLINNLLQSRTTKWDSFLLIHILFAPAQSLKKIDSFSKKDKWMDSFSTTHWKYSTILTKPSI
jgi:hypothetical protein